MLSLSKNARSYLSRIVHGCGLMLALLVPACDPADSEAGAEVVAGEGDLVIAGVVEREASGLAAEFVPTADAHVRITARAFVGADAPAELVAEADVPLDAELPFTYELRGAVDPAALAEASLIVEVRIVNHAGDEIAAGDFLSMSFVEAELGQTDVVVAVEGIAHQEPVDEFDEGGCGI